MSTSVTEQPSVDLRHRRLSVAVADDCLEARMLMRAIFESAGYEVVGEAIDGLGAIELAGRRRPDVMVLDFMMPVLSGIEAIASIREVSPASKVVVLSAMIQDQVHDHLANTAPDAWLVKGAHPEQLTRTIARVTGRLTGHNLLDPPAPDAGSGGYDDTGRPAGSVLADAVTSPHPPADEVIDHGAVGIALLTTTGRFIRVNPAYEQMCGRRVTVLPETWPETLERSDAERATSALGRLVAGELDRYEARVHFDRPDCRRREVDLRLSVLRNGSGLPFKLLVQAADVDTRPGAVTLASLESVVATEPDRLVEESVTEPPPARPIDDAATPQRRGSDEATGSGLLSRSDRAHDLRGALVAGEIAVHYQPVVDLRSGRIVATEALARWDHPEAGLLMPRDFLSLAEHIGVLVPIGRTVIENACRQAQLWRDRYPELDLSMSVNLSAPELGDDRLFEFVRASLQAVDLRADRLCVEVTERALALAGSLGAHAIGRLHDMGVRLVIDDLGESYSARLRALPVDGIKFDRSFLNGLGGTEMAESIVGSTVRVASARHTFTVAKGVDRRDQVTRAGRLGCTVGQGAFFGGAADPEVIEKLLADGS